MFMDLSTPWVPSLNGKYLAPCSLIAELVENNATPLSFKWEHRAWSKRALKSDLNKYPEAVSALWESILAIWRLQVFEDDGLNNPVWTDHMVAWLIRHRDICHSLDIPPFKVVLGYLEVLVAMNALPTGKIPSMFKPVPKPAPAAPRRRIRLREATPDVEMVEANESDNETIAPSKKGKERVRYRGSDVSKNTTSREVSQDSEARGSKRKLQLSPDHVEASSKRLRVTNKTISTARKNKGIDLSEHMFDEDSPVDADLVPRIKGQICQNCVKKRRKTCYVIWHQNKTVVTVRCPCCLANKQGCSFKDVDWGIIAWPTLRTTEEGISRRAKEASMKRKGTASKLEASGSGTKNKPFVLTQESISTVTTRPRACRKTIKVPGSAPSLASISAPSHTASLLMESVVPFQNVLSDPDRTSDSLGLAQLKLRGILRREHGEVRYLAGLVKDRRVFCAPLLAHMNREARRLGGDATDDLSDGSSNVDVVSDIEGDEEYTSARRRW
ncbi:hypothetical protein BDM02DRAFT_3128859 [Thelephora ganbajun]|uniref:Uncharacterized protein n=1 Tax=Thelephora ganbajun TaxID=370292 RepID=A0ACB6ZGS9_THEGA|nr:hypothetical protein BDM02DRAFT_3128859 [Thelephora ganbajun]